MRWELPELATVPSNTSCPVGQRCGSASPPNEGNFDAAAAVRLEKNIRGSFAYTDEEFVSAIELAPHLDLSWSTTYPLSEGAEIFTALMNGQTTPMKALLQP